MGNVAFLGECGHVDLWTFGNAERPKEQPLKDAVCVLWKRWVFPLYTQKPHTSIFNSFWGYAHKLHKPLPAMVFVFFFKTG